MSMFRPKDFSAQGPRGSRRAAHTRSAVVPEPVLQSERKKMNARALKALLLPVVIAAAAAPAAAGPPPGGPPPAPPPPATHNMMLVGENTAFLSPLPMFVGLNRARTAYATPHRYQVLLEVTFSK